MNSLFERQVKSLLHFGKRSRRLSGPLRRDRICRVGSAAVAAGCAGIGIDRRVIRCVRKRKPLRDPPPKHSEGGEGGGGCGGRSSSGGGGSRR